MTTHKAFLFDFEAFDRELRPTLERALADGGCAELVVFIRDHVPSLRDPYEGEPLGAAWEAMIETPDAHQFGDFALTKYYTPRDDIGLGYDWEDVQASLGPPSPHHMSPILGRTLGPPEQPFDPGKLGSYFQSATDVERHHAWVLAHADKPPSGPLGRAARMLGAAVAARRGLFVTF
jgi:hypothetical protein